MPREDVQFPGVPDFKYDGIIREASYMMRHSLAAWDLYLGVQVPVGGKDDEARARAEHAAVQTAISHAKNVLQTLARRRDQLADALVLVERPRVDAAQIPEAEMREQQRRVIAAEQDDDDGA